MIFNGKFLMGWFPGVAGLLMAGVFAAAGAELKVLPGHVPALIAKLAPTGRVAATNQLSLAIGLPLHNVSALNDYLAQVYDPASPNLPPVFDVGGVHRPVRPDGSRLCGGAGLCADERPDGDEDV